MVLGSKKTAEHFIAASDQADLGRASYNPDLSHVEFDETSETFTVTSDRVQFRKPLDIAITVLEANGYTCNFENLLSCLDTLVLGVRIRAHAGESAPLKAKSFLPGLSFQLPAKNRVGYLLKKFYAEIEGYEQDLARLRTADKSEASDRHPTREQMKREIERLQADNDRLQKTVSQLTGELAQSMRSQAHVTKALETNNIIPPQLKPMQVREIDLVERTLTLKAGRSSYVIPLFLLRSMPKIGDACFLNIQGEQIRDVYFHEQPGREFQRIMAEVLQVNGSHCKFRDAQRRIHLWQVKHPQETEMLDQLQRGSPVILSLVDAVIIRITAIRDQDASFWTSQVQEAQTIHQLEKSRDEGPGSLPLFSGKD